MSIMTAICSQISTGKKGRIQLSRPKDKRHLPLAGWAGRENCIAAPLFWLEQGIIERSQLVPDNTLKYCWAPSPYQGAAMLPNAAPGAHAGSSGRAATTGAGVIR